MSAFGKILSVHGLVLTGISATLGGLIGNASDTAVTTGIGSGAVTGALIGTGIGAGGAMLLVKDEPAPQQPVTNGAGNGANPVHNGTPAHNNANPAANNGAHNSGLPAMLRGVVGQTPH